MKTLFESIFDEENHLKHVEKDFYINQLSKLCDNIKVNENEFKDKFDRDLKVGDLIYNEIYHDFGIITSLNNPAINSYNKIDCSATTLDGKYDHDIVRPGCMILIPKSCYKEL